MRALRARLRDDEGYTLAELLITMIILSVVSLVVAGVFISGSQATATSGDIVSDTQSAQVVADHLTRSLRAATNLPNVRNNPGGVATPGFDPGFVVFTPNHVQFYSYLKTGQPANGPALIDESVRVNPTKANDFQLVETVTLATTVNTSPAQYSYGATPTTRVLADGLANPAAPGVAPLFQYLQPLYYAVSGAGDTCTSASANPTAAQADGTTYTSAYVGVQPPQYGTTAAPAVADSIGQVAVTVTAGSTGVNAPAYSNRSHTVVVTSTVTLDDANSASSRPGTCL